MQRCAPRGMPGRYPSRRLVWSLVLLMLASLAGVSFWSWQGRWSPTGGESPLERLGDFGTVPAFALIDQRGQRVTLGDLAGLVWIANFLYTRCTDTCPMQSARLASLHGEMAEARDLRLVSISIDPEHDTPEALQRYAQRFGAHPTHWFFLTGDSEAIYRLAQDGFHLSVVAPGPGAEPHLAPTPVPPAERSGTQGALQSHPQQTALQLSPRSLRKLLQRVLAPPEALAHTGDAHTPLLHSARFVLVDRQARIRGYYHSDAEAAMRRLHRDIRTVLRESWVPQQ